MRKEKCILCGQSAACGLHILGCLLCFPCEKRLVASAMPRRRQKRLIRLYPDT